MGRRNNQPNGSVEGGMGIGEAIQTGGMRREDVYSSLWVTNEATKKIKIEIEIGPRISMAFSGWEDTTTNRKAALTLGYII